ncbi:MAG: biotin carboxylase N-terminal domain-containing protein [Sandaracinaceae bacterium]
MLQTAGVLEIGATGRLGLPKHIDQLRVVDTPPEGRLGAVVRGTDGVFDAYVIDEAGRVHVELRGYRTEALAQVDEALRGPLAGCCRDARFQRIAIVNREGEPAMRLIAAVRERNASGASCRTIALYTDPDRYAMFVRQADGPTASARPS